MTIFVGLKNKQTGDITIGSDGKITAGSCTVRDNEKKYLIINGIFIGFLGIIYPRKILEYTVYDEVEKWLQEVKPTCKSDVFNFNTFLRNLIYQNFTSEYAGNKSEFDLVIILPNRKMFKVSSFNDIEEVDVLVEGSGEKVAEGALQVFLKHKDMFILEKNYSDEEIIREVINITGKFDGSCGGKIYIEKFTK